MKMKVTLWSILSGKLSGHLVLNVPATETLRKVLEEYCAQKGGSVSDNYVIRSKENHILNLNKTLKEADVRDGDTLMIGLLGDEKQTFAFGSWYLVTLASFVIGLSGIGCVVWLSVQQVLPRPQRYGVVIDAGSSHSEVFVFSWDAEEHLGTADVKLVHSCFIEGGINNFVTHLEDLKDYFEPCLSESADQVPPSLQPKTPIYLGATAGMRILKKLDCDGAQNVLTTLAQILAVNSTFKFNSKNVNIISGREEGISGWITVNYLAKNFKKIEDTAAVLDVGGASLQVTSEMTQNTTWEAQQVRLFNKTHKVVSKSFLCYGVEEAQHRYRFHLLRPNRTELNFENTTSETHTDPCLAEGFTERVSPQEMGGPCTLTHDSQTTTRLPTNSAISLSINKRIHTAKTVRREGNVNLTVAGEVEEGVFYSLIGSSEAWKCEKRVSVLFERRRCEETFKFGDCMGPRSVPIGNVTLYAYSGIFHHVMESLGMGPDVSLSAFRGVVTALCSMDANTLLTMYPDLEEEVLRHLCFDGMYVYVLFTTGLGINNSTWSNVVFSNEIGDVEVVWPQGFMINKTSTLASDAHPNTTTTTAATTLPTSVFVLLVCFFTAFIISGIMFLHHSRKIKRHSASYQRCIADHIDTELQRFIQ